ncbi:MAG: PQQ-binding-like beta-propeller repeat protein [Opitutae bacterium]|jgi:outer membrane protein assembly factor BamB|nr:PQQ-binding-like beta-propeller repeat protein [Opitutae bacterium]
MKTFAKACLAFISFHLGVVGWADGEWNSFRGPTGMGVEKQKTPLNWDASSIKWKKEITGSGQSSVIQSGGKLFLTSADQEGGLRFIHCLDKDTGDLLWKKEVKNTREEAVHRMNTWATPTPATDGNRVVAFFGPAGLHCFDLEGKKLWNVDLGDFPGSWGVAASPLIVDGVVLQNCDSMGPSRLVAISLDSGKIVWETKRETKPRGGWSTPIVISVQGKRQIVLNGEFGARGYSLADGKELWFCKSFNGRGSPVPFYDGKLVFVVNGKPGDLYAIDPTGRGDLTKTHMKWHAKRNGGRDLPSPASANGLVLVTSMSGIITCYDAKDGKTLWVDRLKGAFSGSPLVSNGRYYIQNEAGQTYVIDPDREKLKVASENSLSPEANEIFRATLSPISGMIFTRSQSTLYCIAKKKS